MVVVFLLSVSLEGTPDPSVHVTVNVSLPSTSESSMMLSVIQNIDSLFDDMFSTDGDTLKSPTGNKKRNRRDQGGIL